MTATLLVSLALSFAQARARAAQASPELRTARLALPEAEAARNAAGQLPNPTLVTSFGGEDPQASVALDIRLPFLGQRQTALAAAERELPVAQAQISAAAAHTAAAIRRAYFALAAAQADVALASESATLASALEQAVRERAENGSASELEHEQAQVTEQRAEDARLVRLSALADARAELAALLGLPDEDLEASDELIEGRMELAAPPLEQLFARQADHPALAALRLASEAAEARASAARAQVVPVPDLSIGVERGQQAPTTSLRVGVAFELPLLSWNRGRVEEAQVAAQRASSMQLSISLRLRAELRASRTRWEQARARKQLAGTQLVPAAVHLLQLARTAYQLGRAPILSVISAQGDLLAARGAALDAALEEERALADIEEAIGAPL